MDLHILNGDALRPGFTLDGEIAVMREALIDGPLTEDLGQAFEEARARFVAQAYGAFLGENTVAGYRSRIASEWHRALESRASRIFLWFDADAFCQINGLFWLVWLHRHPLAMQGRTAAYIRPQHEEFGRMHPSDLEACLNEAVPIGPSLQIPAEACWRALARQDFDGLAAALKGIPITHVALRKALDLYIRHYRPDPRTGRTHLEDIIAKQRDIFPHDGPQEAFARFARTLPQLGLGDAQFLRLWEPA